jgi:hypothetical protein
MVHMLTLRENEFQNIKKFRKNIHMYISTFYVPTQSFMKKKFLWVVQKTTTNTLRKGLFSSKFYHFYIGHIKIFYFQKSLRRHIGHGYVHTTFLFELF